MVVICEICKKEYEVKNNTYNQNEKRKKSEIHHYFCSKECLRLHNTKKIECMCSNCGKQMTIIPSQYKKSKSGNVFCSQSCNASFWNSKLKPKNDSKSYRKRALDNLEHKCKFCEYDNVKILKVHHIDKNRNNNKLENLLIVCPTHHDEIHAGILDIE